MAPVLAIPVINRPDLLEACLRSIDLDVRLVIIDNSPEGFASLIADDRAWIVRPPSNLGYPTSVNLAITTAPSDPYWLIANADVEFGSGDLARLCAEMEKGGPRWVGVNDWRVFGITRETVAAVGFFDTNFHPCYCEDADYEYRCTLAGVPWGFIRGATSHVGSAAIRSEERYARANARSYPANLAYYEEKWGGPLRGGERFTTPFDLGGSVADWTLRLDRLRDNAWT